MRNGEAPRKALLAAVLLSSGAVCCGAVGASAGPLDSGCLLQLRTPGDAHSEPPPQAVLRPAPQTAAAAVLAAAAASSGSADSGGSADAAAAPPTSAELNSTLMRLKRAVDAAEDMLEGAPAAEPPDAKDTATQEASEAPLSDWLTDELRRTDAYSSGAAATKPTVTEPRVAPVPPRQHVEDTAPLGLALLLLLVLLLAYCLVGPAGAAGACCEASLNALSRFALYSLAVVRWLFALCVWGLAAVGAVLFGLCCCCCFPRSRHRAAESKTIGLWPQRVRGEEQVESLESMGARAERLRHEGKYTEAEKLYRQLWHALESKFGPANPATLNSIGDLAEVLEALGRMGEAEELYRREHAVSAIVNGTEHAHTLRSKESLDRILDARRQGLGS